MSDSDILIRPDDRITLSYISRSQHWPLTCTEIIDGQRIRVLSMTAWFGGSCTRHSIAEGSVLSSPQVSSCRRVPHSILMDDCRFVKFIDRFYRVCIADVSPLVRYRFNKGQGIPLA